jgi:hypothetical protein
LTPPNINPVSQSFSSSPSNAAKRVSKNKSPVTKKIPITDAPSGDDFFSTFGVWSFSWQ